MFDLFIILCSLLLTAKPSRPTSQQAIGVNQLPEKPAPLLRPSTCQARKIYNNVTLLGGMRAGNYTPLGRAVHLEDCIGRACDLNEGHLALMLGRYCYSVMCSNQRTCQTIPAKPSHLRPKVAYLAWTQEPIEQDTSESILFLTFYPKSQEPNFKILRMRLEFYLSCVLLFLHNSLTSSANAKSVRKRKIFQYFRT